GAASCKLREFSGSIGIISLVGLGLSPSKKTSRRSAQNSLGEHSNVSFSIAIGFISTLSGSVFEVIFGTASPSLLATLQESRLRGVFHFLFASNPFHPSFRRKPHLYFETPYAQFTFG